MFRIEPLLAYSQLAISRRRRSSFVCFVPRFAARLVISRNIAKRQGSSATFYLVQRNGPKPPIVFEQPPNRCRASDVVWSEAFLHGRQGPKRPRLSQQAGPRTFLRGPKSPCPQLWLSGDASKKARAPPRQRVLCHSRPSCDCISKSMWNLDCILMLDPNPPLVRTSIDSEASLIVGLMRRECLMPLCSL